MSKVRMIMGVDPKPVLSDYWSENPALKNHEQCQTLCHEACLNWSKDISMLMILKRIQLAFKTNQKEKVAEQNPLYKVQPLFEEVQKNCIEKYNLYQHISIDYDNVYGSALVYSRGTK